MASLALPVATALCKMHLRCARTTMSWALRRHLAPVILLASRLMETPRVVKCVTYSATISASSRVSSGSGHFAFWPHCSLCMQCQGSSPMSHLISWKLELPSVFSLAVCMRSMRIEIPIISGQLLARNSCVCCACCLCFVCVLLAVTPKTSGLE